MGARFWIVPVLLVAACSSGGAPGVVVVPDPMLEFTQNGDAWNAAPVMDELQEVSNNGAGYTGDIHVYEVTSPATGRMLVSLSWAGLSDFDVIVSADRLGTLRIAAGQTSGIAPEYFGFDVIAGQMLYILVAGWEGSPGEYTLETIVVPSGAPPFALEATSDLSAAVPRNLPIRLFFNRELDTSLVVAERIAFVTTGHTAEGTWCIEGRELVFFPRLPEAPGDPGGLLENADYTLQFAAAARGLRAANGEYLSEVVSVPVRTGVLVDEDPLNPPRVIDVNHPLGQPWDGSPITVSVLGPIDPNTVDMRLFVLDEDGNEIDSLPIRFSLRQGYSCVGVLLARLTVEPLGLLPPATPLRLFLPGTVRGVTGDPAPENLLEEFSVDLVTP